MAYRHCAKIWHPDLNPQDPEGANAKLQVINEAYRVLSKPESRRNYDAELAKNKRTSMPAAAAAAASAIDIDEMIAELKKSQAWDANRFEGKDAFLAMILCFLFMMTDPRASLLEFGNIILLWPFLFGSILAAHLVQRISSIYFRFGFRHSEYPVMICSHLCAAFALGYMTTLLEIPLQKQLWSMPLVPALVAAMIPGSIGAGFGRAFNRSIGVTAGLIGGGVSAFLFGVFSSVISIFGLLGYLGPKEILSGGSVDLFWKPITAAIVAAVIAGMMGSFRMRRVFVYAIFDWMDGLIDFFRANRSSN